MLSRLLAWNRRRRQWNRDHVVAWAGHDVPGPAGLSSFQDACESALTTCLHSRGTALTERKLQGTSEQVIHGRLPGVCCEVWIYPDEAHIIGPGKAEVRLEQWSALTPDDLVREFVLHVERALDGARR